MRRRALLTALGTVGLSGCAGMLADRGETTETTPPATRTAEGPETTASGEENTETATDKTTRNDEEDSSGFPPTASVVDLRTGPRTLSLAPLHYRSDDGAKVTAEFADTATEHYPATVRATLTNANDYANTFRLEETPPFGEVTDARLRDRRDLTYESSWYLVPTATHDLVDRSPDYTLGPEGYWRLLGNPAPKLPRTTLLDPGETITGEYVLLGHSEGSGRPTGTYEFTGYGDTSLSITAWETSAPGPAEPSRFAGASPPVLSDGEDEKSSAGPHWYHDAGAETVVYLEPSAELVRTPARLDFTLYNYTRNSVEGNPYHWVLYKFVDGEWFHLAPWGWPSPLGSVPPGGTEDWTLYAFDGKGVQAEGGTSVGFLGGGRYAFEVGMSQDDRSHAALFELVGADITVEPMPGTESSREGATVKVETPNPDHDPRPGVLTLTRADAAERRLIAEQVMRNQFRALRNGLPFFESGVEEVVVTTTENAAQRGTGYDSQVQTFQFEGQAYEARFERETSD